MGLCGGEGANDRMRLAAGGTLLASVITGGSH